MNLTDILTLTLINSCPLLLPQQRDSPLVDSLAFSFVAKIIRNGI